MLLRGRFEAGEVEFLGSPILLSKMCALAAQTGEQLAKGLEAGARNNQELRHSTHQPEPTADEHAGFHHRLLQSILF